MGWIWCIYMIKKRILTAAGLAALFSCAIAAAVISGRQTDDFLVSAGESTVSNVFGEEPDKDSGDLTFAFDRVMVDREDFDYYAYLTDKGYESIGDEKELKAYCKELLELGSGHKAVKYIITENGKFDSVWNEIEKIQSETENNGSPENIYREKTCLYNALGLDYQYYYSRGIAVFLMKKIQNITNNCGDYSVYAIYYYSYNTYEEQLLLNTTIENIISQFEGTDYERMKQAYDYLKLNVKYTEYNDINIHSAYGALINREAVCEGYAKAYKLLLDEMGIENRIVVSREHAWNTVCCDGEWYVTDCTNGSVNNCDAYFMLGHDVLCSDSAVVVDGYIFDENIIDQYGYKDNGNTDVKPLAKGSKNHNIHNYVF